MMYNLPLRKRTLFYSHFKRFDDEFRPHMSVDIKPYNLLGIRICNQGDISIVVLKLYIRDIAYPDLFTLRYFQVDYAIRILEKPMFRIGCGGEIFRLFHQ